MTAQSPEVKGHQKQPEYSNFWPIALVIAIFAVGLALVIMMHWRRGTFIMGFALIVAAAFRALLPPEKAGLLVVRSKAFDLAGLLLAGASMMALAAFVPGGYL